MKTAEDLLWERQNIERNKRLRENSKFYSEDDIILISNIIREIAKPEKIILFGSYAYGTPTEMSDLDFMVIVSDISDDEIIEHKKKIGQQIRKHNPDRIMRRDILFVTFNDVKDALNDGYGAIPIAFEKGRLLYEKSRKKNNRAI